MKKKKFAANGLRVPSEVRFKRRVFKRRARFVTISVENWILIRFYKRKMKIKKKKNYCIYDRLFYIGPLSNSHCKWKKIVKITLALAIITMFIWTILSCVFPFFSMIQLDFALCVNVHNTTSITFTQKILRVDV